MMELNIDNKYLALMVAAGLAVLLTYPIKMLLKIVFKKLKGFTDHTSLRWDDMVVAVISETKWWFIFVWVFSLSISFFDSIQDILDNSKTVSFLAKGALVTISCIQIIIWGFTAISEWKKRKLSAKTDLSSSAAMGLLFTSLQGFLIVSVILMGLSNLGVNIGALITGLGIGGIAVALAAQNVLGDFFASLSIVLDKPFVVGDYIVVGDEEGEVENIGIKTTRIRSISGEELIFSNKDLLESRVRNYKRMWRRRVSHNFQLALNTPIEKLKSVSNQIEDLFKDEKDLKFDRCHLKAFLETSLQFEMVFWVESPSYAIYMDLQEKLLLEILDIFEKEQIDFGLPERVVRMAASKTNMQSHFIRPPELDN
jgi:small-conductance mechanosensitive channel